MTIPTKQPKTIKTRATTRIAVAVVVALGVATPLGFTASRAWADVCYFPNGLPYECHPWIPTNAAVPPPPGVTGGPGGLDSVFLNSLAKYKIGAADGDDDVLVETAKTLCHNLDTGVTGAQEVAQILKEGKLRPDQAEAFVASAVGTYCPNHSNRHDLLGPGR